MGKSIPNVYPLVRLLIYRGEAHRQVTDRLRRSRFSFSVFTIITGWSGRTVFAL